MFIHFLKKIFCPISIIAGLFIACESDIPDRPQENLPPETHIFLQPDSALATTTSRQTLSWWGDDADGIVIGFIYSFDANPAALTHWDENNPASADGYTHIFNKVREERSTGAANVSGSSRTPTHPNSRNSPSSSSKVRHSSLQARCFSLKTSFFVNLFLFL